MPSFPTNLKPDYPVTETVTFNSITQDIPFGPTKTRRRWDYNLTKRGFQLSFSSMTKLEMQLLVSFFNARLGKYESFVWENPLDLIPYTVRFADDSLDIDESGENSFDIKINLIEVMDTANELIIHFDGEDGATTHTAATGQVVTFEGHAQLDTAQKVFGSASLLLDGVDDYVTLPDSNSWNLGTGDFTISFRAMIHNLPANNTYDGLVAHYSDDGVGLWDLVLNNSAGVYSIRLWYNSPSGWTYSEENWTPVVDTFYHIAIVRKNGVVKIYIDGIALSTGFSLTDSLTKVVSTSTLNIGFDRAGSNYFDGWIDEFQVSKRAV